MPTSSIALLLLTIVLFFVFWRIKSIPARVGAWFHARKMKKLALREEEARVRIIEAQADKAEERRDDNNVAKLFAWLNKS